MPTLDARRKANRRTGSQTPAHPVASGTTLGSGADPGIGQKLHDVVVVGSFAGQGGRDRVEIQLDELEELARTLGTRVVERSSIPVREPHPATFFRSGAVDGAPGAPGGRARAPGGG